MLYSQANKAVSLGEGLSEEAQGLAGETQKQGMEAVGQAQQAGMGALNQARQTGQGLVQQGQQTLSKWHRLLALIYDDDECLAHGKNVARCET